jgi:arylsulfatase
MAVMFARQSTNSFAQAQKPNILVIGGDDVGIDNISAYNLGMMGVCLQTKWTLGTIKLAT